MNRRRVLADPGTRTTGVADPGPRIERRAGVVWRRLGHDLLVLGPHATEARLVRAPGGLVWDLLARPATIDQLVSELSVVTGASEEEIRPELEELLAVLMSDEIIGVR